ncbi:hypothetical protein [Actinoallomurus bryophytorum]|uniref:hypothetical protein n=1 Tax=Actinoallomurus bryophytorum TaxID=1490222 RepID=UPI001153F863|nr:hypothetical protein [Actinoallomurus bryophytorum]
MTVAITLAGGNTPTPPPGPVHLDAKGAILAAADRAEQQPIGKYWSLDIIDGQSYIIRAKTGTYAVTGSQSEMFNWQGVKPGMGEVYYARDLPAHPQDTSLWRKAGSPSRFRVWSGDHYDSFTTKGTSWRDSGNGAGIDPRGGGKFRGRSAEELQNLPADPAKLTEMFLTQSAMGFAKPANRPATPAAIPRVQIRTVVGLLFAPVPPKVRAGMIRALATQPGVHSIGPDTDPLGRHGIALASNDMTNGYPEDGGTYRSRSVAVFDERTGALLSIQEELTKPSGEYAEMKPGFIINYETVRSAAWTDTKPGKPSTELPFS